MSTPRKVNVALLMQRFQTQGLLLLTLFLNLGSTQPALQAQALVERSPKNQEVSSLVVSTNSITAQPIQRIAQVNFSEAEAITAAQRRVQVFFPKFPEAGNDFRRVTAVERSTSNSGLARFAIAQLIAGPTAAEQQRGLRPAIRLSGASNCGQDFAIAISNGVARLQFCRRVISNGIGDDARTRSAIEATLRQFSTVQRVVMLDSNGNCLGDQSGLNRCL